MSFEKFFIGSRWQWENWQEVLWGKFLAGFQEWAGKEPPRMPPNIPLPAPNIHWADPVCLKHHLLVPTVAADEYLDGVLGDSRGGSWGLCLTHLWNGNTSNYFILESCQDRTRQARSDGISQSRGDVMLSVAHQKLTGKEGSAQCVTLGADWRGKPALPQLRLSALSSAESRLNFYFLASLERILLCWGQRLLTGDWTFILVSDIIWSDSFDIGLVFKFLQLLLIYVQYVDLN